MSSRHMNLMPYHIIFPNPDKYFQSKFKSGNIPEAALLNVIDCFNQAADFG